MENPKLITFFITHQVFLEMGFEAICFWKKINFLITQTILSLDMFNAIREYPENLNIPTPDRDYYPALTFDLGEKIRKHLLNLTRDYPEIRPFFIKSVEDKEFTGVAIRSPKDLNGCGIQKI